MGFILSVSVAIAILLTLLDFTLTGSIKLQEHIQHKLREKRKAENKYNEIFHCRSCKRFQRRWQMKLHEIIHNEQVCVHCGEENDPYVWFRFSTETSILQPLLNAVDPRKYGDWLQRDPDCPKKRGKEYRLLLKEMKKLRALQKEAQGLKELEEYNKLRKMSHWQKVAVENEMNASVDKV